MRKRILNLLLNNPMQYTMEDLARIFNIADEKLKKSIEDIELEGYSLEFAPRGAIVGYPKSYDHSAIDVSERELERIQMFEYIRELMYQDRDIPIDFFEKGGKKDMIMEMVEEGYLYLKEGNVHTSENHLDFISDEGLFKLLVALNMLRRFHHYGSTLEDIYYKVSEKYVERGYEFNPEAFVYGQGMSSAVLSSGTAIQILNAIKQEKKIKFLYKDAELEITPSLMVYSDIRKDWYVAGSDGSVYRVDRILGEVQIGETSYEKLDQSLACKYKSAIVISSEPQVELAVEFTKKDYIRKRIDRYMETREFAEVEEKEDCYLVTDTVNGIHEIAPFIKSFGQSAKVLSPEKLKKRVEEDYECLLKRYGDIDE